MDVLFATQILPRLLKKTGKTDEDFTTATVAFSSPPQLTSVGTSSVGMTSRTSVAAVGGIISLVFTILFSIAISALSIFLSWSCNTALGNPIVLKLVYATFAFIFGLLYLIVYAVFFRTECKMASLNKAGRYMRVSNARATRNGA